MQYAQHEATQHAHAMFHLNSNGRHRSVLSRMSNHPRSWRSSSLHFLLGWHDRSVCSDNSGHHGGTVHTRDVWLCLDGCHWVEGRVRVDADDDPLLAFARVAHRNGAALRRDKFDGRAGHGRPGGVDERSEWRDVQHAHDERERPGQVELAGLDVELDDERVPPDYGVGAARPPVAIVAHCRPGTISALAVQIQGCDSDSRSSSPGGALPNWLMVAVHASLTRKPPWYEAGHCGTVSTRFVSAKFSVPGGTSRRSSSME
eukprot:2659749-Prymnesium_polylepis.1